MMKTWEGQGTQSDEEVLYWGIGMGTGYYKQRITKGKNQRDSEKKLRWVWLECVRQPRNYEHWSRGVRYGLLHAGPHNHG